MQTISNGVAHSEVSSLKGIGCFKPAVYRHTTTATGRRPSLYITSATLLYSGIFAVAATTDAFVKEKRRKQWDEAIADVKGGIEEVEDRIVKIRKNSPALTAIEDALDLRDADFEDARKGVYGPVWPQNTGWRFEQSNFAPDSMFATRWFWEKHRLGIDKSVKKTRLTELSVEKMALRMLLCFDRDERICAMDDTITGPFRSWLCASRPRLSAKLARIDKLRRTVKKLNGDGSEQDFEPYRGLLARYSRSTTDRSVAANQALESRLQETFSAYRTGQCGSLKTIILMLDNIINAPFLPSIGVWNSITENTSKLGSSSEITELAIRAARSSHVRMNEQFVMTILDHYRRTNNRSRFMYFSKLLRGHDSGLYLAHPDINISDRFMGRVFTVERFGREKKMQKMSSTPQVFYKVMDGLLHFLEFQEALEYARPFTVEGWGLSITSLTSLLVNCVERQNWEQGHAVWKQIKAVQRRSRLEGPSEKIQSGTYAAMLRLCQLCDQKHEYATISSEALSSGVTPNRLLDQLQRIVEAVDLQNHFRRIPRKVQQRSSDSATEDIRDTNPSVQSVVRPDTSEAQLGEQDDEKAMVSQPVSTHTGPLSSTAAESDQTQSVANPMPSGAAVRNSTPSLPSLSSSASIVLSALRQRRAGPEDAAGGHPRVEEECPRRSIPASWRSGLSYG